MSAQKWLYAILLVFMIVGCVPSLHEFYTPETITWDPALVGCWQASEQEQWCFTRHLQEDAYDLIISGENEKRSVLIAHLINLEGQRYLDLYPSGDVDICTGDWYKYHLLPVHTCMKVEQTDPNLVMAIMQPDAVRDLLRRNPKLIEHNIVDDRVVLTASTPRLQALLADPQINEKIFEEPGVLTPYKP